jgi:hypothetical protein
MTDLTQFPVALISDVYSFNFRQTCSVTSSVQPGEPKKGPRISDTPRKLAMLGTESMKQFAVILEICRLK